jgi:hypothetical protein
MQPILCCCVLYKIYPSYISNYYYYYSHNYYYANIGWAAVDWIDLAQDKGAVEGLCEHGNEPSGSIKCWEVLE